MHKIIEWLHVQAWHFVLLGGKNGDDGNRINRDSSIFKCIPPWSYPRFSSESIVRNEVQPLMMLFMCLMIIQQLLSYMFSFTVDEDHCFAIELLLLSATLMLDTIILMWDFVWNDAILHCFLIVTHYLSWPLVHSGDVTQYAPWFSLKSLCLVFGWYWLDLIIVSQSLLIKMLSPTSCNLAILYFCCHEANEILFSGFSGTWFW